MRDISSFVRLALPFALVIVGCAHARPQAPHPQPSAGQPGATAPNDPATSPPPTESSPSSPDPSEQITAEEMATIPDPVPGASEEPALIDPGVPSGGATQAVPPAATPPAAAPPPSASGSAPDATSWIWRVQIFASPDRAQAERTARDASARMNESYVVDYEGSLYKVRMGAFATEAEAEPLKRKAVIEGYTGAFRVRTAPR